VTRKKNYNTTNEKFWKRKKRHENKRKERKFLKKKKSEENFKEIYSWFVLLLGLTTPNQEGKPKKIPGPR